MYNRGSFFDDPTIAGREGEREGGREGGNDTFAFDWVGFDWSRREGGREGVPDVSNADDGRKSRGYEKQHFYLR